MWQTKLKNLKSKYKRDFYVQKFIDFPQEWIIYDSEHYKEFIKEHKFVNHREIMDDEIVIDIDFDSDDETLSLPLIVSKTQVLAGIIYERLLEHKYSFVCYQSGGKGWHFHLTFPELLTMSEEYRNDIKLQFLRYIGQDSSKSVKDKPHVCCVNKKLIQIEGAMHRRGKVKSVYPNYSNTSLIEENKLPKKVYDMYTAYIESIKRINDKYNTNVEEPFWVKIFESPFCALKTDGRDRAAFVLAAYYTTKYGPDEAKNKLFEWNKNILKGYHKEKILIAKLKTCAKKKTVPHKYAIRILEELDYDIGVK